MCYGLEELSQNQTRTRSVEAEHLVGRCWTNAAKNDVAGASDESLSHWQVYSRERRYTGG